MEHSDIELDVAPDEADLLAPLEDTAPRLRLAPDPDGPAEQTALTDAPLASVLPHGFQLTTLLQFLPDVRLKREADALAAEALAVDVAAEGGLALADTKLAQMRESTSLILKCFEYPVDLAYQLHKRLTGLRNDFTASLEAAAKTLNRRVVDENGRLRQVADEARRQAQREADARARQEAARAAQQAEAAKAPAPVVERLREAAQTAVAPPVASPAPAPAMASTSVVQKWKGRLRGTPAEAEPNPKVADLTPDQQETARRLCAAIGQGLEPLSAIELNWSYINRRAAAEKSALEMTGLEAFDEGGVRSKGRR